MSRDLHKQFWDTVDFPENHSATFLGRRFGGLGYGLRQKARDAKPKRTSASRKALTNTARRLRYHPGSDR